MNLTEEDEIKKEFHLERIIFFSDAIFAIIITIMILDVKLPELAKNATEEESKNALLQLLGKVVAYGVSFFVIGRFWMRHMQIYRFVKDFDKNLLVLNLLFLFTVSLFPFALSFWFSSSVLKQYSWGVITFIGIGYFTLFTQVLLMGYLIKNKRTLCIRTDEIETALKWKVRRANYFIIPFMIILMVCCSYFNLKEYIVYAALIINRIVVSRLSNHYYPDHNRESVTVLSLIGFKKKPGKRIRTKPGQMV